MALALALCGLCAWQWYVQTVLRNHVDALNQSIFKQSIEIQGYTNSIHTMDTEVADLQTRITSLKTETVTNHQLILEQKRDLLRLKLTSESLSNEIVQYQQATNVLEMKLAEAYNGIKKQNDAIAELAAQRDDFIAKYTNSIKARNDLVEQYNALVDRVKKMQNAAAGTGSKQ